MIACVKFCKKNSKSLPFPYFNFFSFFLSKDWWKTKRNPSKPKVVYLKKYRFHARKVEDSEHAIYDVCERDRCSLTESRPPAVRRPAPGQIKMYGFCRPFRAMPLHRDPVCLRKETLIIIDGMKRFQTDARSSFDYQLLRPKVRPNLRKKKLKHILLPVRSISILVVDRA